MKARLSQRLQAVVNEAVTATNQAMDMLSVPRVAQWSESLAATAGDVASSVSADVGQLGLQVGEVLSAYPVFNPGKILPQGEYRDYLDLIIERSKSDDGDSAYLSYEEAPPFHVWRYLDEHGWLDPSLRSEWYNYPEGDVRGYSVFPGPAFGPSPDDPDFPNFLALPNPGGGLAKDMRKLLSDAEDQGCVVSKGKKHYKVRCPEGPQIVVSATPSDRRAILKARAQFRRDAGLTLNPVAGVPGGSVTDCITIMEGRGNVRDPGALCASIARKRGEVITRRKKGNKKKARKNPSLLRKALK